MASRVNKWEREDSSDEGIWNKTRMHTNRFGGASFGLEKEAGDIFGWKWVIHSWTGGLLINDLNNFTIWIWMLGALDGYIIFTPNVRSKLFSTVFDTSQDIKFSCPTCYVAFSTLDEHWTMIIFHRVWHCKILKISALFVTLLYP